MTKLQKDHIVLLESIDSKVQILMESVIALGHKLDAIGSSFRVIREISGGLVLSCTVANQSDL